MPPTLIPRVLLSVPPRWPLPGDTTGDVAASGTLCPPGPTRSGPPGAAGRGGGQRDPSAARDTGPAAARGGTGPKRTGSEEQTAPLHSSLQVSFPPGLSSALGVAGPPLTGPLPRAAILGTEPARARGGPSSSLNDTPRRTRVPPLL